MMWKNIQKQNYTKLTSLIEFLQLSEKEAQKLIQKKSFPLNIPFRLANKMEKGNLHDPLLRQYVPLNDEEFAMPGYEANPVKDETFCQTNRLLQKYSGRVLLLCTGVCAMHCRFCFRQNFDYAPQRYDFHKEINWIKQRKDIHEVILSGGDPLSLSDDHLQKLLQELGEISHVRCIRFHSRFPIGIPERITENFLRILKNQKKQTIFALHINHARELDEDVIRAMRMILETKTPVLSQTVLLQGVNDNLNALKELFLQLISSGIIPYYLHQLDPIAGGHHFYVDPDKGLQLIHELQKILPGYAVPKYVKEIPGIPKKTPIGYFYDSQSDSSYLGSISRCI